VWKLASVESGQGVLVVREEGSCESRSFEEILELGRSGTLEDLLLAKRVLKVSKKPFWCAC